MRLAIILDDIQLYKLEGGLKRVVLFDADGDLIFAVGEDRLSIANTNYLCLWLLGKRVSRLYCDGLNRKTVELLKKAGIESYPLKKIRNNPMLHALLLESAPGDNKDSRSV